mgnify:FL=1
MALWNIIVWIGAARLLYVVGYFGYEKFFCKVDLEKYKYGWVLVTGATDGIGKKVALSFARNNFKVLLCSRNEDKLKQVAAEIKQATQNENVQFVVADFKYSHRDPENFYNDLTQRLSEYNISVLINNVGVANLGWISEQKPEDMEEMLGVNIYPQTLMSYFFIPKFLERFESNKQRSLLINFSSIAEAAIMPTAGVYSATKRYNSFLSEALRYEYSHAIDVVTVKPGPVMTNMARKFGSGISPIAVDCDKWVNNFMKNMHTGVNYGHWSHYLSATLASSVPYQIYSPILQLMIPVLIKLKIIR